MAVITFNSLRHLLVLVFCTTVIATYSPQALRSCAPHRAKCRCIPGDACWPSDTDWRALNITLGGKLVKTVPIASACHTNQAFATYDARKCATLQSVWDAPETHIESSSSIMAPFFANQSCDPFTAPDFHCVIGSYVQYSVRATQASDYQAAIKFARERNIRLVIRNTAHDYHGKSSGGGSLAIWTHHLKNMEVLDYRSSSYLGKAVKVGAGVQFLEAYPFAQSKGLVVVGGNCPTVGIAGGYSQGAGHGTFASRFGLAADQVLEWEVVTADGKLLTSTPEKNKDLYWALSGGGGGTYAVAVSLTVKAYPDAKTTAATFSFFSSGVSQETYYGAVGTYIANAIPLTNAGAVSTFLLSNTSCSVAPILSMNMSKAEMDALVQPTIDVLKKAGIAYNYVSREFPTFLDAYHETNPDTAVSIFQIGGRLIPRNVISSNLNDLVNALRTINSKGALISGMSLNADSKSHPPNAVNPAWRETGLSIVLGTFWDNTNWSTNLANQKLITDVLVPELDKVPNKSPPAAYMNEADTFEPNWQSVFYGKNYRALLRVKRQYDPNGVFWARTAVGSELWTEGAGGRLCRT